MFFFNILSIIFIQKTNSNLTDSLFNSIKGDNYNLTLIYHYNFDNIKIKHLSKKTKNKTICILGILVNENGIKIAKKMLNWLIPEYDIYLIYQKYPGILYEYPALRFAQWILETLNKTILLYVHTKGAFNARNDQNKVIELWKKEFTHPRNKIYIKNLLKNKTDISVPFRKGICTWFNGMFISKRAFDLIFEVTINKRRHFYEGGIFNSAHIRIKGIINDDQSPLGIGNSLFEYFKFHKQKNEINIILQEIILLLFLILFKLYVNNNIFIFFELKKK